MPCAAWGVTPRRQEAYHLNRLGKVDEAIVKLENMLQDNPSDTEAISYLGRIYKDTWTETWENIEDKEKRFQEAFDASHWLIKSIQTYLLDHLAERYDEGDDLDVQEIRDILPNLKGALELTLENLAQDDASDYWTLASLAELRIMVAEDPKEAKRAYKKALTSARKNTFYLQSSIDQLQILNLLDLRPEFVDAGVQVLKDEIRRIRKEEPEEDELEEKETEPGRVYLFTGHKIDTQNEKRFLPEMEEEVRKRINKALDKYQAGENDLAFTSGAACGGDIIFIEACLNRGMTVEVHLPLSEPQ
ncbi:MAG: hypothetical protein B5M51_09870 [Anaerolinea sp. 4484_236]|nr:MAG: hypothetical protein B5M51_09870 [Anaerolinea sp. 4484_236]